MQHSTVSRALSGALALATSLFFACGGGSEDSPDGGPGSGAFITVDAVTPDHGPLGGGNTVVITGSGFLLAGAAQNNALLDGTLADRVSVIDNNTIEIVVPPGDEAGPVSITLFNGNGSASLGDVYSYNPLPTLSATNPTEGNYLGGDTVTLTGSGFQALEPGNSTVLFAGSPAEIVDITSDTSMTVVAPAGTPTTTALVTVENNNGSSEPHKGYLYTTDGLLMFGHTSNGFDVADASDPEPGEVFHLDPLTLVVEPLGMQITTFDNQGASVCTGTAIQDNAIFAKATGNLLIRHDLVTNQSERLDPLEGCAKVHSLTSHQGELYAICRDNDSQDFGRIDPENRTFTQIGNVDAQCCRNNLASDGTRLYFMSETRISEINANTGAIGQSVQLDTNSMRGLAFANGVLYGIERSFAGKGGEGPNTLFSINPATGATQNLGIVGSSLRGLAPLR